MLKFVRRVINGIAATVVYVALYLASTAFVLVVLVLALFQPRKPVHP